ncbi:MAG TPA: carbohydrate ABC transporter permease [Fimbriimonas sp.]|nr:carbohydrate ABC transporter permease [Fimbriimonas sp.]
MSTGIFYIIGTICSWVGFGLSLTVVYLLFQKWKLGKNVPIAPTLIPAVVLSIVGFLLVKPYEAAAVKVPLFWVVMPWTGWIIVCCAATVLFNVYKLIFATSREPVEKYFGSSVIAVLVAIAAWLLYRLDDQNKVEILKGGIPLSFGLAGSLLAIVIAYLFMTVAFSTSHKLRNVGKTILLQLSMLAGTVVFGIPFAFLLITSFKEDKDMSSKSGIIWVPRVTETVPYFPKEPSKKHYVAEYEGNEVEATIIGEQDGKAKMDIFRPLAIRGITFLADKASLKEVPIKAKVYSAKVDGTAVTGFEKEAMEDGSLKLVLMTPPAMKDREVTLLSSEAEAVRHIGLKTDNYPEALEYMPPETARGFLYLRNTLFLVVMGIIGTVLSSSFVSYGFSRLKFPGKEALFSILLATMMLPGAVTMLPKFLIFKELRMIDTLYPLWVPAFFGSAFNIFLFRQFFSQIPGELEDAAKIDGCSYIGTWWRVMLPQIKPALAAVSVGTLLGVWNDFMGPLIYINSPESMPLSYALNLFKGDRSGEPGLLMAFTMMSFVPVVLVFFFAQKYIIENTSLSGLGGR